MEEITTIGLDLAKSVFQVHAVGFDGKTVLRRQVRRAQMLAFFGTLAPCLIGMEACAFVGETIPRIVSWPSSPHYWARELTGLGHDVRLMPPSYVKPYVKRGKTDAIDAEAICEGLKPLAPRSIDPGDRWKAQDDTPDHAVRAGQDRRSQAVLMTHRVRDFLVRQLTQVTVAPQVRFQRNAIRAHLGECGIVAPKGVHNVVHLLAMAEGAALPESARQPMQFLAEQFRDTRRRIDAITADVKARAQMDTVARRLQTIPGIGPITAGAIAASVPDVSNFNAARDLAASC